MPEVTGLAPLLAACARLDRDGERADPEALAVLRSSLRSIFRILAELVAANPERRGWIADPKKPGYLVSSREHDGELLEVHVPLTIVDGFPPPEVLEEIIGIAQAIRSGRDTAICLSGSAAVYSALQLVSDVDFCEYVDLPLGVDRVEGTDRSFARTLATAAAVQGDRLLCFGVEFFPDSRSSPARVGVRRPWSPPPAQDGRLIGLARKVRAGKCDFIAQSRFQGTVEVTNMVLFVDAEQPGEVSGDRSFPFQEAPIIPSGGWVPRRLEEPLVLGRYINWLHQEAEKLIRNGKSAKAAKRIYALSNTLFRADLSDRVLDLWEEHSQELGLGGTLLARLELRKRLRGMSSDPAVLVFEGPLARTLATLAGEAKGLDLPDLQDLDDAEAFSDWCEEAERHLRSASSNRRTTTQLRHVLRELAGLLGGRGL